ncbi:patched domain-containing protein 3-like isoform X2 [Mya arenaria]|nr:patched domain-containing protein 3-like isoform X2 [Mya arenaria]
MEDTFPDLSGKNYHSLQDVLFEQYWARVIVKGTSGNLLSRTMLQEVSDINKQIQTISVTDDTGNNSKFSDLCVRAYDACAVDGSIFWDADFLTAVDHGTVSYPAFISTTVGSVNYASRLGGAKSFDANSYLTKMEYIQLGYALRTDTGQKATVKKWMDAFVEKLSSFSSDKLDIAYGHFSSLDEELDKNVNGDIALFSVTITLMLTYACVATFSFRDSVSQRSILGFAGILAAGLAIIASFGLCSIIGVDFVSIVGVVPFLVIGIGIDDMFILLSGMSGAQGETTIENKMAEALRSSGVGITITSITDLIAFLAGVGSSFLAVRNFCIYTAVAVVFCYINNISLFAACLTINERRVEQNRHFFTCRRVKPKEELKAIGKSNLYAICCGGSPPNNRNDAESFLDKFPRWLFPKVVLKLPFKIIIIVLFVCYLAFGIYGCVNLKQGLNLSQLVQDDSYFYKYSTRLETYFSRQTPVAFVTINDYTYSDFDTKNQINSVIKTAQDHEYFDDTFEHNWLNTYMASTYYDGSSESDFIAGFKSFISDRRYSRFENDVVFDSNERRIAASKFYVLSSDLSDSQEEGKMMLKAREIADREKFQCFASSPAFIAFEQYVRILGQTLQTVGIALAAVFVVTCFFMPHPVLIVFVTLAVTMIMVGVFGYMLYIDVALSAITMIHLIMSIGFSIDFTAHICHGYMISTGVSRDERVRQAFDHTGAPIFHGAMSSLIGVVVLYFAKSYIFKTFAFVMSFVLLFGIAHALLLLPVILSWRGPGRLTVSNELKGKTEQVEKETEVFL